MSSKGILQFFTKATPEEAEEQQKQCWETLHDGLHWETIDSRVNDEQEAINQAERMRDKSCYCSKAYQDQCRTQLEVAGEDNPRRKQVLMIAMLNGEGVQADEDGGFVVRSALDEEVVDEGESEKEYSDDPDKGVHDPMVIDLEDEVSNSKDIKYIDPLLSDQSID